MGITTDRLPPLTDSTSKKSWAISRARSGGRVDIKELRVAVTELQRNNLLEAGSRAAEGQFAVGDFGLGLSSQVMLRGLDVVHQVGLQLQRRRSPGALAQEVIQILESMLGYDNTAILLVDRPSRQLKPFALSEKTYGKDFSQAYEKYIAAHDLRLGVGVPGWVAHHGQPLFYGDVLRESRLEGLITEMRSALFVPIRVEGVVIGTLGVESRLVDAFTPLDQQLLETVAGQIAIAIQNAHLFSRVRREVADEADDFGPTLDAQYMNGDEPYNSSELEPIERVTVAVDHAGPAPVAANPVNLAETQQLNQDHLSQVTGSESNGQTLTAAEESIRTPVIVTSAENDTSIVVADLRAQVEELVAFSHTVAHDLKNPLSILLGFADVLAHDTVSSEDEVLDQAIRVIIENGRRMENIINELLLLAEVRTVEEIPLMPLDIPAVVAETSRRLSNFINEYHAQIELPESWPQAMGHQPWVEEIWVNYVSNAIRYGGPSPRVLLGGELLGDGMARFWVRDFGEGISLADQQRLFIPFTKLQQANTQGHGLGLSIVQRIAKRLGGSVGVESEPGKGSRFWFTLPAIS